jgi:F-type H+-transporting ATPase subunit alpha
MGVSLFAAEKGYLQDIEVAKVLDFEAALISFMNSTYTELMNDVNATGNFNGEIEASLKEGIEKFKATQTW